jgi:hypothetical protein
MTPPPPEFHDRGLYVAILRRDKMDYPMPFEYGGDERESAWGYAERMEFFKDTIISVIPAYKFGSNKFSKFLASRAINSGEFL